MSKQRILSWKPDWSERGSGGRWCKQIDGQVRYFGRGKSESDSKSYKVAQDAYFDFLKDREVSLPVEIPLDEATLKDVCEKYLQTLEARHNSRNVEQRVSASHVEQTRCCLKDFWSCVGEKKRVGCIGELDLDEYRNRTLDLPLNGSKLKRRKLKPISPATARDRLKAVRALYRWAWKMHIIENLPRNIDDIARTNGNVAPEENIKTFSLDELKKIWSIAPSRTRCFIALALNCGMGQKDISDLKRNEIDLDGGYIERARSKTNIRAKHKLWKVTRELLAEHADLRVAGDKPVFLGENDKELVRRWLVNGRQKISDAVKNAFGRVTRKAGFPSTGHGFYGLRKTGATMIEQIDPAVTEMYLSHAEPGMKRSYAERHWARLDLAIEEMEKRLKDVLATGIRG